MVISMKLSSCYIIRSDFVSILCGGDHDFGYMVAETRLLFASRSIP